MQHIIFSVSTFNIFKVMHDFVIITSCNCRKSWLFFFIKGKLPRKELKDIRLYSAFTEFSPVGGYSWPRASSHPDGLLMPVTCEHALMHLLFRENRFIRENWSSVKGLVPRSIRIPCALIFSTSRSVSDRTRSPPFFYEKRFPRESNASAMKLNFKPNNSLTFFQTPS